CSRRSCAAAWCCARPAGRGRCRSPPGTDPWAPRSDRPRERGRRRSGPRSAGRASRSRPRAGARGRDGWRSIRSRPASPRGSPPPARRPGARRAPAPAPSGGGRGRARGPARRSGSTCGSSSDPPRRASRAPPCRPRRSRGGAGWRCSTRTASGWRRGDGPWRSKYTRAGLPFARGRPPAVLVEPGAPGYAPRHHVEHPRVAGPTGPPGAPGRPPLAHPPRMSATAGLWRAIEPIYAAILAHPFLRGLTDGSLDREAFRFYAVQDALYLRDFARALSIAAARAPREEWIIMFNQHAAGALEVEMTLHESFFKDFGLSPEDVAATPLAPTNAAYTSYLLAVAYGRPFHEEFGAVVRAVLACTDTLAARLGEEERHAMRRHFVTTSRYEWMFWDMGWRREAWPV